MLKMDGFDDCIIGILYRCGCEPFLVYDQAKVLRKLEGMGMTEEEAYEYYQFNQESAWMGDGTPGFLVEYDPDFDYEEDFCE